MGKIITELILNESSKLRYIIVKIVKYIRKYKEIKIIVYDIHDEIMKEAVEND